MTNQYSGPSIGRIGAVALVIGNMVGSGIFLLPSSLAGIGGISLIGWIISAMGALVLAKIFSELSKRIKGSGGPYLYTKNGFGDFAGFWVAWGYWISVWATNAAITVAFLSYSSFFFPILKDNSLVSIIAGLSVIWTLIWINSLGIKKSSLVQIITTVIKVVPIIILTLFGIFSINWSHFVPFNISQQTDISAIASATTLTLFAFLGVESATIPALNIRNPEKTIPWATKAGTLLVIVLYIFSSIAVMGLVEPTILAQSNAPFADAANALVGDAGSYIMVIAAMVSTFGALNGWIIIQGEMPKAAAIDGLFPSIFKKTNANGAPVAGMILSGILISVLMSFNFSEGLNNAFEFIILLSTLAVLVPYLFCSAVFMMNVEDTLGLSKKIQIYTVGIGGVLFSIWAIIGSGMESVYWGFVLLMSGIPLYIFIKKKQ